MTAPLSWSLWLAAQDAASASGPVTHQLATGAIEQSMGGRAMGLVGVVAMVAFAWAVSTNRRAVSWRLVAMGTGLQLVFALIVLKTGVGRALFAGANTAITKLLSFSEIGSRFIFGKLADNNVPVGPVADGAFAPMAPLLSTELWANTGSMIAFRVLPTVLFFSALTAVFYHLGVMTVVVKGIAWVMQRTMKTSGAESLSAAANIFVGQTEAPLVVRPFVERMTQSELMCIMTGGFATIAGGVMAAYVALLSPRFPDIAGHLLAASLMSAPAALVMAKIMVPETDTPETLNAGAIKLEKVDANVIDAAARGTTEGVHLALNVGAMLIAFIALVALIDFAVGGILGLVGVEGMSLSKLFGWLGAPVAFLLGVPWEDAPRIGTLLGSKTVLNEFVAYSQLSTMLDNGELKHAKSVVIATYALCGFSNFSSIGIQIGGLAALAPSRRSDLARLGLRAMVAGSFACFQTAAVAAMVL